MSDVLLSIRDLCVDYITDRGPVRAVDRVSLDVRRGEIVGIAGESGCGKSTLAQALMRILPPPAVITGGEVLFEGRDLLALDESALREMRWARMSMVFQSAMDALNPVLTIGEQLIDTMRARPVRDPDLSLAHAPREVLNPSMTVGEQMADSVESHPLAASGDVKARARELLAMVGIQPHVLDAYAHQLSGGMRQRVGIALALALEPSLVILDEPTTALDVIVERDILAQIRTLQERLGFAVLFITHDLARMLQFSDRVAVFYAAQLVEVGPSATMGSAPRHPYTQGLLRAFPTVHGDAATLESIPGVPPSLASPPRGCRFAERCAVAEERCRREAPVLREVGAAHAASCWRAG